MHPLLQILLSVLIAGPVIFVVTYFLQDQDGIANIFLLIRKRLKVFEEKFDDQSNQWYNLDGSGFWAKLFGCFWCLSTWVAAIVCLSIVVIFQQPWYFWPYEWMASITVAGLVYIYKS